MSVLVEAFSRSDCELDGDGLDETQRYQYSQIASEGLNAELRRRCTELFGETVRLAEPGSGDWNLLARGMGIENRTGDAEDIYQALVESYWPERHDEWVQEARRRGGEE